MALPVWEGNRICAKCVHFMENDGGHLCARSRWEKVNYVTGETEEFFFSCSGENQGGRCKSFKTPEGHLLMLPVPAEELTLWQRIWHWWDGESWPERPQEPLP